MDHTTYGVQNAEHPAFHPQTSAPLIKGQSFLLLFIASIPFQFVPKICQEYQNVSNNIELYPNPE